MLTVVGIPAAGQAAPIYVGGPGYAGECPTDAQMADASNGYTRQYSVMPSLRCMFDPESSNIQGTQAEADLYLNTATAALAGWHQLADPTDNWVGLGINPTGFSFTTDAGNDDGTFTINQAILQYDQFAVAVKDGSIPFWAIFELSIDQTTGDWHFLTGGGSLSHFALFGRNTLDITQNCTNPPCQTIQEAPEPTSLLLLGSGLAVAGKIRSRRKKR
jgi:hypothetical protein